MFNKAKLFKILAVAVCLVFIASAFAYVYNSGSNNPQNKPSAMVIPAPGNITLDGNVTNNFAGHIIAQNNRPSLWGENNNIKDLYLTYNSSYLFIGVYEDISFNSLLVAINNVTGSIYGTTSMAALNTWSRDISFSIPINYFSAVYFDGENSNPQSQSTFSIASNPSSSSSLATAIQSHFVFGSSNNTTEIAIPWSSLFPNGFNGNLEFGISTFVIGGSGPWVGTGIPYVQTGAYDNGTQSTFLVNDTIALEIMDLHVRPTPSYKDYPSFLLLNNFVNNEIWVATGIHDTFLGYPYANESFSIQTMDFNNTIFPISAYFNTAEQTISAGLTSNNIILVNATNSSTSIFDPPYGNQVDVVHESRNGDNNSLHISGIYSYSVGNSFILIDTSPVVYVHYTNSKAVISESSRNMFINISSNPGTSSIVFSVGSGHIMNLTQAFRANNNSIALWLKKGVSPQLSGTLFNEYNMSLLLVKDDQNPMTGEIAASPSPVYLYTWVRDGSFAAMSLQDAGHINSALKYWEWMSSVQGKDSPNGTWQTRFDFWNGAVSTDWIAPEYDSVGLFQIGIDNLYTVTQNTSLIIRFMGDINNSLTFEENAISDYGLIPEDHSIWEQQLGYYFWTQSIDDLGMKDSLNLLSASNQFSFNSLDDHKFVSLAINESTLTNNIVKYFYADGIFAQYITPISSQYPGANASYTTFLMNNTPDASQILPLALGFLNSNMQFSKYVVSNVVSILENDRVGGLPRYYNDLYHYTEYGGYLQSSGPSPPWIITSLFLGEYDESVGNMTGALNMLSWASNHTQSGLLPEAIDPNFGTIIASTSPLTWSSAMYVIVSLGYEHQNTQWSF